MRIMEKSYQIQYVGQALIHSYCTEHMLPWIVSEIRLGRRTSNVALSLSVTGVDVIRKFFSEVISESDEKGRECRATESDASGDHHLNDFSPADNPGRTEGGIPNGNGAGTRNNILNPNENLFHFEYSTIVAFQTVHYKHVPHLALLTRKGKDAPIFCHVFTGHDSFESVCDLIKVRILQEKKNGIQCSFGKLGASNDHEDENDAVRFEVMLMGVVNLKNPDPSQSLIDEAVDQFNEKYAEIAKRSAAAHEEQNHASSGHRLSDTLEFHPSTSNSFMDDSREGSLQMLADMRKRCNSVDQHASRPAVRRRQRHCSEPTVHTSNFHRNRIRLFQIGRDSLKMICPNKANRTMQIDFSNISRCMQGIKQREYFGIIANKADPSKNRSQGNAGSGSNHADTCNGERKVVCYVFKCAEDYVCEEIMQGIKQAFASCVNTASPMHEYDDLCKDIGSLSLVDALSITKQRMRDLNENEIKCIKAQLQEINPKNQEDKLAAVMAALRQRYEVKHIEHLSNVKASEPVESPASVNAPMVKTLGSIRNKALTSFGSLILKGKKKMQELQSDAEQLSEKNLSPVQKLKFFSDSLSNSAPNTPQKNTSDPDIHNNEVRRKRSTSLSSKPSSKELSDRSTEAPTLFYQKIFNSIINTGSTCRRGPSLPVASHCSTVFSKPIVKYDTAEDIRKAWKWAIEQQVLMNRIKKIQLEEVAPHLAVSGRELQKSDDDLELVPEEMVDIWNELFDLAMDHEDFDDRLLKAAISKGIPGDYRGRAWKLLRQNQYPMMSTGSRSMEKTYTEQLENLTPFQHAILIDIGRTFPSHPMYSQQLGPGQLSLFNVLKAYSLFDEEVGYCQGLSFIAGVLLMHTYVENEAYELLYSLMHEVGCRTMYLPDMKGMKLAIYKLTRLLYDHDLEVYTFFEKHEVSMMLVATPWFLTMFASTFPMKFVTRVFDIIFAEGMQGLYKVALCLLQEHKHKFMKQDDFEDIVNYIRTSIPESSDQSLQDVITNAMAMDVQSQLDEYGVEYRVMQDELPITLQVAESQKHLEDQIHCLESVNHKVTESNCSLLQQLQDAQQKVASLQKQLKDAAKHARQSYYYT